MSKFETLSPKYSASVSADAGVALGAHAHTAAAPSVLNYVRCKNCVSVFRSRPYVRRVHRRNIVISVPYSFTAKRYVFCFVFISDNSVRGHACECADFDSGVIELAEGISLKINSELTLTVRFQCSFRMGCDGGRVRGGVACAARCRGTN